MKVLDLFSCVGCHALGMIAAGHDVIAMCEIDAWRRKVLKIKLPGIPVYDDVKTLEPPRADVCFGGPPCQHTSVGAAISGKRTGATLWPFMLYAGLNAGTEWFVVEQPPGNKTWETKVTNDLADTGRHVAIFSFGANDIGAPYIRRRRYIFAGPSLSRLALARDAFPQAIDRVARSAVARNLWNKNAIPFHRMDDWRSERPHERKRRLIALGDSNPPAMAEVVGLVLKAVE